MIADEAGARTWLEAQPEWNSTARERIERFVALLSEENARQNLVSANSLAAVWHRHIADSAQLLRHVPRETAGPWLDLGSGAGLPGLVIAALRPEWSITLTESRARRADWLQRAVSALALPNTKIMGSRLEMVTTAKFRVISARAFAPLPKLLDLSARFSTADTLWLLPKGRSAQQELDALPAAAHMFHVEQSLTDPEGGIIVGHLRGRKGENA